MSRQASLAQVWAPTEFVRKGFVRSGLDPTKAYVVPHGVGAEMCALPGGAPPGQPPPDPLGLDRLHTERRLTLLYHGGLLYRKGVDLLLRAYFRAFVDVKDTLLVVHSVYGDAPVQRLIRRQVTTRRKLLSCMAQRRGY